MENRSQDNKRIAKNTLYMYLRMGFSMFVGLYTSRVVLQNLGVEDYGLYNVIGSIIAMFSFINGSMVNTTSRYITVSIGKGDKLKTRQIFNMASLIHLCIALIILVIGETIGLWYLYNKMVIPDGRLFAAEWLYQLSVLTAVLNIIIVPFNATIVAHEKMGTFAAIQMMDVVLKLIIVILLTYSPFDKLIFYGSLLAAVTVLNLSIYYIYCKRHFEESSLMFYWDKLIFKEMMPFAGWALVGNFSYVFYSQGINLMLNFFCGPAVNAARGIAVQVESLVKQFAGNVQTAINPQIIKSYAKEDMERMYSLIFASSRYCFYLLFFLSLPIMIEADYILKLWLGTVPDHTVNFIRITLVITILDAFINPMYTANLASGKLRVYHLTLSILMYSFMFITFGSIYFTHVPESVFLCLLFCTVVGVVMRVFILDKQIGLNPTLYAKTVLIPVLKVVVISSIVPVLLHDYLDNGLLNFIIVGASAVFSVAISIYKFGVSSYERQYVHNFIKNKILSRLK